MHKSELKMTGELSKHVFKSGVSFLKLNQYTKFSDLCINLLQCPVWVKYSNFQKYFLSHQKKLTFNQAQGKDIH